jgi:MFS family permease
MLFKQIPRDNYLMLVAVFFMKAGQFMIMPFMAIYLQNFPHASPTKIGIAIGLGPLVYGCFSPLGGWLVDRFGCRRMSVLALIGSAFNIYFFFALHLWWYCFLMSALLGFTRCIFDVSSRTYRMHQQSLNIRRFFFGLRFTVINSAAAIGPFAGAVAATTHSLFVFHFVGIGYLLMSGLTWFFLHADEPHHLAGKSTIQIKTMWHIIAYDRTMTFLISAALLFWVVFSQIDSTLPQYLHYILPHSLQLYSTMLIINALMCACLQIITTHYLQRISIRWVNRAGVALLFLSFIAAAQATKDSGFLSYIILLTFAELLLAPIQDYLVSIIATPSLLGSYYGALGISVLGIGIGPILGGILFQHSTGSLVYVSCAALTFCIGLCYRQVFKRLDTRPAS